MITTTTTTTATTTTTITTTINTSMDAASNAHMAAATLLTVEHAAASTMAPSSHRSTTKAGLRQPAILSERCGPSGGTNGSTIRACFDPCRARRGPKTEVHNHPLPKMGWKSRICPFLSPPSPYIQKRPLLLKDLRLVHYPSGHRAPKPKDCFRHARAPPEGHNEPIFG